MNEPKLRLLTVRACCESANLSPATFYRLAKADPSFPPLIKIGGSTRVREDAWEEYIDTRAKRGGRVA